MATCNLTTLLQQACANGFNSLSSRAQVEMAVQLAYNWSGSTQTLEELLASSCANGFTSLSERAQKEQVAQILCNISNGT